MYTLLFENQDFIIVCKPVSISVHCDDQITGFAAQLSQQMQTKLYVVHRLDKVTSGLMILPNRPVWRRSSGQCLRRTWLQNTTWR